jgi:hypothetical protein
VPFDNIFDDDDESADSIGPKFAFLPYLIYVTVGVDATMPDLCKGGFGADDHLWSHRGMRAMTLFLDGYGNPWELPAMKPDCSDTSTEKWSYNSGQLNASSDTDLDVFKALDLVTAHSARCLQFWAHTAGAMHVLVHALKFAVMRGSCRVVWYGLNVLERILDDLKGSQDGVHRTTPCYEAIRWVMIGMMHMQVCEEDFGLVGTRTMMLDVGARAGRILNERMISKVVQPELLGDA